MSRTRVLSVWTRTFAKQRADCCRLGAVPWQLVRQFRSASDPTVISLGSVGDLLDLLSHVRAFDASQAVAPGQSRVGVGSAVDGLGHNWARR